MSSQVEQIKQRLSVADVVGSYIKLQKAGANFKAPCPFHSEKAPSFYVSPPREIWHCFGCNAGGDMFEFVKKIEGVEFPEALRILADRAGVTLTQQDPEIRNEKTRLLDILKGAVWFYQKQLTENKDVLDYLWKRGLKNEILKDFNIGFAPEEEKGWRNLFNYLKSKGFSGNEIEKTGLVINKAGGEFYDRFRGRVMFPLKDTSGRVVGFSGRIIEDKGDVGKYINTPQTVLYDKSKNLYGFDRAKMEIRKKDACILVEGQMDVLMSHQAGTTNTVAVSGTALTTQHLEIIKRLTTNLIMAFDSDDAGLVAAKRSIDLALENNFETLAVSIPTGKDPAEIIKEDSKIWLDSIKNSAHIIEFYLNILEEKYKDDTRKFKLEVEKDILPYVLLIQSSIDKNHWVKEIANRLGVKEDIISDQLKNTRATISNSEKNKEPKQQNEETKNRQTILQERLAGIALWKKDNSLVCESALKILENKDDVYKNKLALEAELRCQGAENLDKEIEFLDKELRKETLKGKLEILADDVRKLELVGEKEELQKKMTEFQKLSKQLAKI